MTDLKNLKKVKGFDIEEFNGVKSVIEVVELSDIEEKDFGDGLVQTRQIIVKSANLSESDKELRAVEFISLKYDTETKEFGIPENPNSKAMKFLNYFKVDNFEDLKGKECLIVKKAKGEKTFLGISH